MNEIFRTTKNTEKSKVVVIDYGLGNVRSMMGAVERVGYPVSVSNNPAELKAAAKLILPGVGAFGDGMKNLHALKLVDLLNRLVLEEKKPILGVCLGSQLFAKESFEFGHHQGMGWLDASVIKIEPKDKSLKVPHVGWDETVRVKDDALFADIPGHALFYFVHSFFMECREPGTVIGTCDYGVRMGVSFHKGNIYGTQFHPEKSQLHGLVLLKNFLDQ